MLPLARKPGRIVTRNTFVTALRLIQSLVTIISVESIVVRNEQISNEQKYSEVTDIFRQNYIRNKRIQPVLERMNRNTIVKAIELLPGHPIDYSGSRRLSSAISTNKIIYNYGEDILVQFSTDNAKSRNLVAVYPADADSNDLPRKSLVWLYTCNSQSCNTGASSGNIIFGSGDPKESGEMTWPLPPAEYRVHFIPNNIFSWFVTKSVAYSHVFTVSTLEVVYTPTSEPNASPTITPTKSPINFFTNEPTTPPTITPTKVPTLEPTLGPTEEPSRRPTSSPATSVPTISPTLTPTRNPTSLPTETPTKTPYKLISSAPTVNPTAFFIRRRHVIRDVIFQFGGNVIWPVDEVSIQLWQNVTGHQIAEEMRSTAFDEAKEIEVIVSVKDGTAKSGKFTFNVGVQYNIERTFSVVRDLPTDDTVRSAIVSAFQIDTDTAGYLEVLRGVPAFSEASNPLLIVPWTITQETVTEMTSWLIGIIGAGCAIVLALVGYIALRCRNSSVPVGDSVFGDYDDDESSLTESMHNRGFDFTSIRTLGSSFNSLQHSMSKL